MGWDIAFKSLNNVSCHAYINAGSGQATPLTGGANPVVFDEDNDDDLLKVIRYKTGYLNIVETSAGQTAGLFPSTNTSHKVKVMYGQEVIFIGFMQAQTFENDWCAPPREMSFPIMSPLALLENMQMPIYNPPRMVTLASLLADVVDALNAAGAEYTQIIWPQMSVGLDATINSLVVSPFNSEASPAPASPPLYTPVTCQWFIEGLCNAFGWMVHDCNSTLLFTKYDHTGNYLTCTAANLRTLTSVSTLPTSGSASFDLTTYMTPSDNDGKVSSIMPYKRVQLNYDGEYRMSADFPYSHFYFIGEQARNNDRVAWLERVQDVDYGWTPDAEGPYLLSQNAINSDGKLVSTGATICSFGSISNQQEGILVSLPSQTTFVSDWLFKIYFFERPSGSSFSFTFDKAWGNNILALSNQGQDDDGNPRYHKEVAITISVGDYFYHGAGEWSLTPVNPSAVTSMSLENVPDGPICVTFYEYIVQIHQGYTLMPIISLTNIKLEESQALFSNYKEVKNNNDYCWGGDGTGQDDAIVAMHFSCYRKGTNMIGSTLLYRSNWFTNYEYLLYSRQKLNIRFKRTNYTLVSTLYIGQVSFDGNTWRVISISHDPWNDEVTVTLQRTLS